MQRFKYIESITKKAQEWVELNNKKRFRDISKLIPSNIYRWDILEKLTEENFKNSKLYKISKKAGYPTSFLMKESLYFLQCRCMYCKQIDDYRAYQNKTGNRWWKPSACQENDGKSLFWAN